MASSDSDKYALLDDLAAEFAARYRKGERPPLQEYIDRHPDLADEIRELFPAMVQIEQVKEGNGPVAGRPPAGVSPNGNRVGDYQVVREVGRGGMGVVYEAQQLSLGRRVALKILPLHAARDGKALERFQREAKAAAKLHHTNIVPVFEVGRDGDTCFYAMQFIPGQPLDQVIDELRRLRAEKSAPGQAPPPEQPGVEDGGAAPRRLARSLLTGQFRPQDLGGSSPVSAMPDTIPVLAATAPTEPVALPGPADLSGAEADRPQYFRSVAHIGEQVAQALAYAHERGVIHRDVKPSNLLLDAAGVVWVSDFGLAKTQESNLTESGEILGTLRYLAPERFQARCDVRSDVYALGLTLYELLTLRPAFDCPDRLRLIETIYTQEPPRPRALDPRLPRDLETIVLKASDKDPARRYPTAGAMAEDLRRFLADEPVRARRVGMPERLWRWRRRNRVVASLATAVLLLVLTVAVGSSVAAVWLGRALAEAGRANTVANARLWESLLVQARATRKSGQPGQRFDSLRTIQEAMKLPLPEGRSLSELRTEAIAALLLPDLEVAREWDGWPTGSWCVAIDNAFERYARGDKDGNVSVRRLKNDEELFRLPGMKVPPYGEEGLRFSPDGRFLHVRWQVGEELRSRLWRLDGPQAVVVLEDNHSGFAFRPDSQVFAAAYADGSIRLYETATGREQRRWGAGLTQRARLAWHPKLPRLAIATATGWQVVDLETQKVLQEEPLPGPGEGYFFLEWHPEGRLVAVTSGHSIALWDTQTKRLVRLLSGHTGGGTVARFNRAGDRLFTNDWSGNLRMWDVRTGRQLLTRPAGWASLFFSSDDGLLGPALADPRFQLFRCGTGRELRTVLPPDSTDGRPAGYLNGAVLSIGGRLVAVHSYRGAALVDVTRAEEVALLPPAASVVIRFEAADQAVWTYGEGRLLRWPIRDVPAARQVHCVGPAEQLPPSNGRNVEWAGSSRDGNVIAIPSFNRGALLWHRKTNTNLTLGPQEDVRRCAVSPDGRWVATATHHLSQGVGAKVWEAETGRHVADLPVPGQCWVNFSPDGKWLVTNAGGFRIWEVGSWREGPALGGPAYYGVPAFSSDGKLLALGGDPGVVRLVVPETGKEIARLTAPEQTRLQPQCFTPDGGQLITIGADSQALHIFDLRAIRAQLAELGLDWNQPPLPPAPPADAEPLRIEVELGDLLGRPQGDQDGQRRTNLPTVNRAR
jgi:serine/threonine protein kinase/WD40 repeat protein